MTIPLAAAISRILESTAANEGPDARCTVPALGSEEPVMVRHVLGLKHLPDDAQVSLCRTVRNWTIESASGTVLLQSHPWDDTPNVAKLGTRPDPAHIESLVQFSSRVQELANEAERLRQFVIAQNLWQMVSVINHYTGQPVENAIREAQRLTEVVAALVPTPKPRA
jgi:hypothetical protein